MYKVIDIESFYPRDEPLVTIIDPTSTKDLIKQAADSHIIEYASKIKPDPSRIYVHIIAMGASGSGPTGAEGGPWPMNRNGDIFPEESLIKYHKTYEEHGYVYRNHINKNKDIAMGKVVFSSYNHAMARIEILAWIDKKRGADIIERIDAGDFPATSMACRLPYDFCSICGNKAHTRAEYCSHLRNELGKVYPDGRRVGAVNMGPLTLMDISIVVRPADVISSVLSKVASHGDQRIQSSAEVAEELGLTDDPSFDKKASLQKLSEFVKEIDDGFVVDSDPELSNLLAKVKDLDLNLVNDLKHFKLNDTVEVMASLGINPSLAFLAELIAVKLMGDHMKGSGHTIASLMHKVDTSAITIPKELSEEASEHPSPLIAKSLSSSMEGSSLLPSYVEKRAYMFEHPTREDFTGMHKNTNIGFIGSGQNGHLEETPFEKWTDLNNSGKTQPGFMKILNTLLAVGGAALAAKWYIDRAIEKKMRENVSLNSQAIGNNVKLLLVKQSSDYRLTRKLSKAAMVKCIKERSKI